jgi:hypothetical protein
MKLKTIFIFCFIFSANLAFSQHYRSGSNTTLLKKNTFYVTLGVEIGEFYGTLLANYEHMLFHIPNSFIHSMWLRVGGGPYTQWGGKGVNYVSTLSALIGRKSSHIEIGSGVLLSYNSIEKKFHPLVHNSHLAGNLGYRYQKPGGQFIFRAGIGWPEFTYLSLGVCF